MAETLRTASIRESDSGKRFLKALRLISILALAMSLLSVAFDWLSASGKYFEDGATWIYDSAIYGLVAISFGRGAFFERAAAFMLSAVLTAAGCQGSYDVWSEIARRGHDVSVDTPVSTMVFATGAILEAALLFKFRKSGESLMMATWLSARNSAAVALAGAAVSLVFHAPTASGPQIFLDCLDTVLAFQAAFLVAKETIET